jgi:hypothetical protein
MNSIYIEAHKEDIPSFSKVPIDEISKDEKTKYWIKDVIINPYVFTIFITLSESAIQCENFNAWAKMEAYYGFTIKYKYDINRNRCKDKWSIGGYETKEITANSLKELISKLGEYNVC